MQRETDVVVIGAGPGGYAAAFMAADLGLKTLPPTFTEEAAADPAFLRALYHVLMNVHLVRGMLTCPATGREFPVTDGIANFMLEEDECDNVRY